MWQPFLLARAIPEIDVVVAISLEEIS